MNGIVRNSRQFERNKLRAILHI